MRELSLDRRAFLAAAAGVSAGFLGLRRALETRTPTLSVQTPYGPPVDDPNGVFALPNGFRYQVFSPVGATMDDGFLVPAYHDGMGAFPAGEGRTLLVRNHEVDWAADPGQGPFGPRLELLDRFGSDLIWDPGDGSGGPALGGTTTLLYDTRAQRLLGHRLSLTGTIRNCAGGPTPWGSWVSCEETVLRRGEGRLRDHGYCFEVPATWEAPLSAPVPLTAMGRFNHEAVAVDPTTGIVYLTEDENDGLLYRFLPDRRAVLARGGSLQALVVRGQASLDTRNRRTSTTRIEAGPRLPVRWISLDHVDDPDGDLRLRGFEAGAARFARGEGMWWSGEGFYFACTNGGAARKGQIWRYQPGPAEGTPLERSEPGTLELFLEADEGTLVESADNLTVAPWGDLIVCEDGPDDDKVVGITPAGSVYPFARNMGGNGELAGPTFSPDGSTLFLNLQCEGLTVAVTGPWRT